MPNQPHLDVWLYGIRIARLSEPSRFRYRLDFTDDALDRFGDGARILSLALPIQRTPIIDGKGPAGHRVSAFVEGLLPEGNLRRHIATHAGIPTTDAVGLLHEAGAECAGAVQFLPEGRQPVSGQPRRLTDDEVNRLVADLPTYHLPPGVTPQASLAGIQDKVLLVALPGGGWGWPEYGAPSTHIIKPEPLHNTAVPHLVQTEDWALRVARHAGVNAADSRLERFDERDAIIVTRYDRTSTSQRIHQEDFCQALGLDPQARYESTAEYECQGSRLRRLTQLAAPRTPEPDAFRTAVLEAVTFNIAIGNGDAHSKNYSLLIDPNGSVSLAPIYDTAPVMHLDPRYTGTGHIINGRSNIDAVTIDDLVDEATTWGMSDRRARTIIDTTLQRVHAGIDQVPLPPGAEAVRPNLTNFWTRRAWPTANPKPAIDDDQTPRHDMIWVQPYTNHHGTRVPGHWRHRATRR